MKYEFSRYVAQDSVMVLEGKTKLEVMDELITRAADLTKLNRDVIFRMTWKREQMMTTGVGNALALPHIRVNDIPNPVVIVGVTEHPITDYQTQDDQPVRVIVFTIAPDENPEAYLQLLGSISRKLRNPELVINFYNERRKQLLDVKPNEGHLGLAALEKDFQVTDGELEELLEALQNDYLSGNALNPSWGDYAAELSLTHEGSNSLPVSIEEGSALAETLSLPDSPVYLTGTSYPISKDSFPNTFQFLQELGVIS